MIEIQALKEQVFQFCKSHLNAKIELTNAEIRSLQESANEETKSSAGDKYETGRAMAQLEIEKLSEQVANLRQQVQTLNHVDVLKHNPQAQLGSLVLTDNGIFFLAVSIGQCKINEKAIFCLSVSSPIGALLVGKSKGSTFTFNKRQFKVIDLC